MSYPRNLKEDPYGGYAEYNEGPEMLEGQPDRLFELTDEYGLSAPEMASELDGVGASFTPVPVERPGGGRIKHKTPANPPDLVIVTGLGGRRIRLHRHAAEAWKAMVRAARRSGLTYPLLLPISGYRSPEAQKRLWEEAKQKHGSPAEARTWVAPPFGSAHQTGRAIDFYLGGSNSSVNAPQLRKLRAYRWLAANASRFGFYPYEREPWHWEYNPPYGSSFEIAQEAYEAADSLETLSDLSPEFQRATEYLQENFEDTELAGAMRFFKDSPALKRAPLAVPLPVFINKQWPSIRKFLARTYNRLGGVMSAVANQAGIETEAALAVWQVESGGRIHTPGKTIIRFENHLLFRLWGRINPEAYNQYFRHGGHDGQPGRSWENHQFRGAASGAFQSFHGNQEREYKVLSLAARVAGENIALQCISIGGPQILVSNYRMLGYSTPRGMYNAFQEDERAHVLGFFDFCNQRNAPRKGDLLRHLRQHQWFAFAKYYNGAGQIHVYGGRIQNAYLHAKAMSA
jgi:hypothetical protein